MTLPGLTLAKQRSEFASPHTRGRATRPPLRYPPSPKPIAPNRRDPASNWSTEFAAGTSVLAQGGADKGCDPTPGGPSTSAKRTRVPAKGGPTGGRDPTPEAPPASTTHLRVPAKGGPTEGRDPAPGGPIRGRDPTPGGPTLTTPLIAVAAIGHVTVATATSDATS